MPFILSGVSILSKATEYSNGGLYFNKDYSAEYRSWILPNSYFNKKKPYATYKKFTNRLFLNKSYQWLAIPPRTKKEEEKPEYVAHYQSSNSIIFDAKKNILALHGTSALTYGNLTLEADIIALHLNANIIRAQGTKDLHNTSIGSPIFTYKDVIKNKYGKDSATQTRTFFMEKIWYNIETKRALVDTLLTKQKESIVKSKQVKKEDEETFYAEDIIYTTCGLAHPHFYIRTKRAKMVQDKQITTGPFQFYFDHSPTPLGCVFGTLFLEGKRTHGIIPPEIGEGDHGFYLRKGGYYINFNDYADISILGSIYSTGIRELNNELRYKKRYLCSGNVYYATNIEEKKKGWSLKWAHKTLAHGPKSFNAKVDFHSESYEKFDYEDKKNIKKMEEQSAASLSYRDQLIGFPYGLTVRAEFKENMTSNFKDWTLPRGTLSSVSWYPFRMVRSKGVNRWFHAIQLKHNIDFENHFQNAKKEPEPSSNSSSSLVVPSTHQWNHYTETGIKHTIPFSMQCKLFEYINLKPHFTYDEGWYWLKKGTKGPIPVPGFNRVYAWHVGAELGTTLYCTHYFEEARSVQGFRIKTEPSVDFTHTPDFSRKYYYQTVKKTQGKEAQKYAFEGLRPRVDLAGHATSILSCKLHNTVELKVKKEEDPEKKEKKQTSRKIFLLKNLDFETKYDFQAKERPLDDIDMHIASEAKVGAMGKIGFDLTTKFDPYRSLPNPLDSGDIKKEFTNEFAWNHGQYLGKVKEVKFKATIDFADDSVKKKKKKKKLFNDRDHLTHKMEENKIEFEVPWTFGSEFNWIYQKLYEYKQGNKDYNTEKYITFNGTITLVKKWKVSLRTTYNFTKNESDPSATEIYIQRDLHCWQLSYQWYPRSNPAKYDFSLGVKANVLKALKLPRKRSYNKLS
ncbi:putative LPS assembly protein LptD [Cardinium endosymbiont of Oedothorax gibbosus]|uniref:putative LPS assembly protein LptD n=1 Tax=Cardinium endosymbiont of Oedothorax gibbosus TaxID=931101 RepID=UPI0020258AB3|nr:putative LPS assembly protein LptD [Cardinium endosymbiont of Oedothorax gibbosus]CAH2559602.1 hypothetical protein CAOEGIBSW744_0034 [Cardinium endosymbiont of Oedothorax gibbosus]